DIDEFPLRPAGIAEVIELIESGEISYSMASQKLFSVMLENPNVSVKELAEKNDFIQHKDDNVVLEFVREVLKQHPNEVDRFKSGDKKLMSFFMGELMKLSRGKVEPKTANAALKNELEN